MATEIEIDFTDDNDDEQNQTNESLSNAADDDISIEDVPPISPNAPLFQPTVKSKDLDREKKRLEREAEKKIKAQERDLRKQQQEALSKARQEFTERARADREEYKRLTDQARGQLSDVRADSVNTRIGMYSLASSLGLKGYVTASIADQFLVRPQEEKYRRSSETHQNQIDEYREAMRVFREQTLKDSQEAIKRDYEQHINNLRPPGNPPNGPTPPTPPNPPNFVPPGGGGGQGGRGGQPPIPPGGGGGQPPIPPIPPVGTPPPVPPTPPGPPPVPPGLQGAGVPLQAVAATFETLRAINNTIDNMFREGTSALTNTIEGKNIEATKKYAGVAQSMIDPIGVNIPVNVAVQSFNSLLDLNQSILDAVSETQGFAPLTLEKTIEGELKLLQAQIKSAMMLDPITAKLTEANNNFNIAWLEVRNELIRRMAPTIITLLQILTGAMTTAVPIGSALLEHALGIKPILDILKAIYAFFGGEDEVDEDTDILKDIAAFFDPNNNLHDHADALAKRRIKMPITKMPIHGQ